MAIMLMRNAPDKAADEVELSIVMPCLNEARTLPVCITKAQHFFQRCALVGEVVVADNGSTDGSQQLATELGARVVPVARRGYGAALQEGIAAAAGKFVIMGDADDSYDFSRLDAFVDALREGHDLVMGNRFRGGIKSGAMPMLHRYLGNPGLTMLARLLFRVPCRDVYCGLRGFRKAAIQRLDVRSPGMEFALEMLVKAKLQGLIITEVPTTLSPDGRDRPPHLKTWRDGRRSLRFYLCCTPNWLFLYPGLTLILGSAGLSAVAWWLPRLLGDGAFVAHALLLAAFATIVGVQALFFAVLAKINAIAMHLLPPDTTFQKILGRCRLEHALAGAALLVGLGALGVARLLSITRTGAAPDQLMLALIPSAWLLTLGPQVGFCCVYLSLVKAWLRQPDLQPAQAMSAEEQTEVVPLEQRVPAHVPAGMPTSGGGL